MGFNATVDMKVILLCALAIGYFILRALQLYRIFSHKKFILWAGLRLGALLCLMLVLGGVQLVLTSRDTTTVFLVDRSLSAVQGQKEVEDYINRQLGNNKKTGDLTGVVAFAKEPMVEAPVSAENHEIRLETQPDPAATDIQKALEFCRDLFPENTNKRLVVFTDGMENSGSVISTWKSLEENGINTVLYPLNSSYDRDVQLTSMEMPENIHYREKIPLKVVIDSNFDTQGIFYLYNGNTRMFEKKLEVKEGTNSFEFEISLGQDIKPTFWGETDFQGDVNLKNNVCTITPAVKNTPSILVVGDKKDTSNIDALLDSLDLKHINYPSRQVPGSIDVISSFNVVILANVAHGDLTDEFEASLETCVKEKGTGLIVVGGENTFAPGGYEKTRLENMLPVTCSMKGKKRQPDTGLVLVLDCSGSMDDRSGGVRKLDLVKQAAVQSSQVLDTEDYLGVIGFSDVVEWVVPFGQAKDKEQIKNDIGKLSPKGGTLILPALEKAEKALENADVKVKHIILLTDGQAEKNGYENIFNCMKESGITLSTVAVGKDSDRELLESLSKAGGGRSYYAEDLYEVPEIFTKETYLGTKKYLNNEDFIPGKVDSSEFFKDIPLPVLHGYTGAGIKEGADMILKSNTDDPILAQWSYGLGKVVVWTPDLSGKWSSDWIQWDDFRREWGKLVNACLSPEQDDMDVRIERKGYDVSLFVETGLKERGQTMEAELRDEEGDTKQIRLEQARPGEFAGNASLEKTGEYFLTFRLIKDGKPIKNDSRILHLDYSPEYSLYEENRESTYFLAKEGIANKETNVFRLPLKRKNRSERELDFLLLPLALILFIADIGVRKVFG